MMETPTKTARERSDSSSSSHEYLSILSCNLVEHNKRSGKAKGEDLVSAEMMNSDSTMRKRGRGQNKRYWTAKEDSALMESLLELYHNTKWRNEDGFKSGYLAHMEVVLEAKLPGCGIQASPHIESRVKTLKKKYCALSEMLSQSGFGWDDKQMMLVCDKIVYEEWVKTRKEASGLYGKPFPLYYVMAEIYGKGRPLNVHAGKANRNEVEIRQEYADGDQNLGGEDPCGDNVHLTCEDNVHLNVDTNSESEFEGMEDFDVSFSAKQHRSGQTTPSVSNDGRRVKAKVMEAIGKNYGSMAASVEALRSKIDILVNILSTDKEVAELQGKLDAELCRIEGLSELQVFRAINILARNHDLLRVFFAMSEERKKVYVTNLLEYGL